MYVVQNLCDTDLNEVGKKNTAELLLEDLPVGMVVVAAGDEGGEEDIGQTGVAEVLEGQRAELLQHRRRLARLQDHLKSKTAR